MILVLHSSRLPGHVPGSWRGWSVIFSGFSLFQSSANTALDSSCKRNSIFGEVEQSTPSLSYCINVILSLCLSKMQIARNDETSNLAWKVFFFYFYPESVLSNFICRTEYLDWSSLVFSISPSQLFHDYLRIDSSKFINQLLLNYRDYRYTKHT